MCLVIPEGFRNCAAAKYCSGTVSLVLLLAVALCSGGGREVSAALLSRPTIEHLAARRELLGSFSLLGTKSLRTPAACRSRVCTSMPHHRSVPAVLPSWNSSIPEHAEAMMSGEWDVHWKAQNGDAGGIPDVSAANAAAEAIRSAAGASEAEAFSRLWEALRGGKLLSLSLSNNRVASLRILRSWPVNNTLSFRGIWQVRARPFLPTVLEVELGFPSEVPEVILVLRAPLKAGFWLRQVPQLVSGDASLSFSPFFPWNTQRLGIVAISPRRKNPTVDTMLQ